MTRVGRPNSDDPKNHIVGCRLNTQELAELEAYCKEKQITKGKVIKKGIQIVLHETEGK